MLAHIITAARNNGLIRNPRFDRARAGRMGKTPVLHFGEEQPNLRFGSWFLLSY